LKTIAVMQPYFVPYAGYFRLLSATDLFVVYDCVQFPRRGWVHRNRLPDATGELRWLTLPLASAPQTVPIRDLEFRADASHDLLSQFARFPVLADARATDPLYQALVDVSGSPVDYIERLLRLAAEMLGVRWISLRSSELDISPALRGQDRIIAIVQTLGGARYVNPPGGRALYDPDRFTHAGLDLRFLPDYRGSQASILARLLCEAPRSIADEMAACCELMP
jgi:hypothetical protein